ncbi:MAG: polysaccharide biosynthesis/export family protein [Prevotella sp.]|nr:polysaccharide biosynthesis/export family protein [Prevotella sp.]
MKKSKRKYLKWTFFGMMGVCLLSACASAKKSTYFQDVKNLSQTITAQAAEIKLKENDKISIVVKSKDPTISELFNLPITQQMVGQRTDPTSYQRQSQQSQYASGYTIDADGNIDFPLIGKINIAGKTRMETAAYIKEMLEKQEYAKDLVVTVEYMNLHVSILGEVKEPGQYSIDQDKITVLDALAKAGDLTIYGRRDSVMVIRQDGNQNTTYLINMTSAKDVLQSPAYYLQQNDVVYVAPNAARKRQTNEFQSTSFWLSVSSLLTTIALFIFK